MSEEIIVPSYDIAVINNSVDMTSKIDEIVKKVKKRIADLKLETIAATEENKKVLKDTRADLNKEVQKYEEEIKSIDKMINAGLDELKKQYKEKIKVLYSLTDKELKDKIEEITNQQIKENEDYSKEYYNSKLKSMPLRLGVRYEDVPWDFKFNSSKKSIRTTCDEHFEKIEKALMVIDTHTYKTQLEEIWIKKKYDLGEALVELQTQLAIADKIVEQKLEAEKLKNERAVEQQRLEAERTTKQAEAKAVQKKSLEVKPVEIIPVVEEILDYAFTFEMTDSQLQKLINFLVEEDITFTLVE